MSVHMCVYAYLSACRSLIARITVVVATEAAGYDQHNGTVFRSNFPPISVLEMCRHHLRLKTFMRLTDNQFSFDYSQLIKRDEKQICRKLAETVGSVEAGIH